MDCVSSFCTYIMGELIRHQPCNELPHHLCLIIYSLDGDENLPGTEKCLVSEQRSMNSSHINTLYLYCNVKQRKQPDGCCAVFYWHLSERTRCDHIVHPFHSEASAQLDRLHVTFSCSGEGGEEEAHAKCIFDITESIDEGGVPATQRSTSKAKQLHTIYYTLYHT